VLLLETTWRYTDQVAVDLAAAADPFASDVGASIVATATATKILRVPRVRIDMVTPLAMPAAAGSPQR